MPKTYYLKSKEKYFLDSSKYDRISQWLGWSRLALFILLIYLVWVFFDQKSILILLVIIGVGLFSILVRYNQKIDYLLKLHKNLLKINTDELIHFNKIPPDSDSGEKYIKELKLESNDLDIFGIGSLFQLINRSCSDMGKDLLAESLINTKNYNEIKSNQAVITELKNERYWVQTLTALQLMSPTTSKSLSILINWISSLRLRNSHRMLDLSRFVLPGISITILIAFAVGYLSNAYFTLLVFIVLGVQGVIANWAHHQFKHISKIQDELTALSPSLEWIECKTFNTEKLKLLQANLLNKNRKASRSIQTLTSLVHQYEYRLNPVFFLPLNFVTWWDLHLIKSLWNWTNTFEGNIKRWYETLGYFELFSSYGTLAFNHPTWTIPTISNNWFTFDAKELGHPLLNPEKVVTNDFTMIDPQRLTFITGSNMAGKSTFLRSIGANLILANAGSVVCASAFTYSPGTYLSSMRISDNLQEETSTFYAELKKIKIMIDAMKSENQVILLIDEMLRGTNAEDRKAGVNAFIGQMLKNKAVGIIASHDPSIYAFCKDHPEETKPYYFDSAVEQDQLIFDYKIKNGTEPSANASFLMRKIGIEI